MGQRVAFIIATKSVPEISILVLCDILIEMLCGQHGNTFDFTTQQAGGVIAQ